jgi:hypothetical protein
MALTAATIQTFITNLTATYTTLSQEYAQSRSAAGRSQVMARMEDIRKEITAWEERLARTGGSAVNYAEFEGTQ